MGEEKNYLHDLSTRRLLAKIINAESIDIICSYAGPVGILKKLARLKLLRVATLAPLAAAPSVARSSGKLLVVALTSRTSEAWGAGVAGMEEEQREGRRECSQRRQGNLPATMGNLPASTGKARDARRRSSDGR
jgi:hypothetical protein